MKLIKFQSPPDVILSYKIFEIVCLLIGKTSKDDREKLGLSTIESDYLERLYNEYRALDDFQKGD